MDDPNITMKEYIRLEEEKAKKHGKVFNWETAMYGKIWYDEDVLDPRSVETEFPAIVFNDSLKSNETPSCEPTVSSFNDEIDFRILFDESNDEDYTVVFDKNSFSYKIISTNDLKMDSKNNNDKVNMPLFSTPKPEEPFEEVDNVGKVFINLEISKCWSLEISKCWSLEISRRLFFAQTLKMENHLEQTIRGVSSF
ncbi:hypothetical protein Tco_1231784 [Tanacetum coccineum]